MTPDLMEEGARRAAAHAVAVPAGKTESGGRAAGFARPLTHGEVDVSHGRILYLEDVSVSFDGFKAINKLSLEEQRIVGALRQKNDVMEDLHGGRARRRAEARAGAAQVRLGKVRQEIQALNTQKAQILARAPK